MADKPNYKLINDIVARGELFEFHGSRATDDTGRILGGEFLMFAYTRPPCGMQSVALFAMFHVMQCHALYGVDVTSTAYATGIDAALQSLDMLDEVLHRAVAANSRRAIMRACTYRDDVKADEQLVEEINRELFGDKVLVAPHLRSNPAHPIHAHNPFIPDLRSGAMLRARDGVVSLDDDDDDAGDDDDDDAYFEEHDNIDDDADGLDNVEVPAYDSPGQLPEELVFTADDVALIEGCQEIMQRYYANKRERLMDVLSAVVMSVPFTEGEFDMGAVHSNFLSARNIRQDLQLRAEEADDDDSDDSDDFDNDDAD